MGAMNASISSPLSVAWYPSLVVVPLLFLLHWPSGVTCPFLRWTTRRRRRLPGGAFARRISPASLILSNSMDCYIFRGFWVCGYYFLMFSSKAQVQGVRRSCAITPFATSAP